MSLIEDALRKAQRSLAPPPHKPSGPASPQTTQPTRPPQPATKPQPAIPPQPPVTRTSSSKQTLPWLLLGVLSALLLVVGLRSGTRWTAHPPTRSEPAVIDSEPIPSEEAATYRALESVVPRRVSGRTPWLPSSAPPLKLEGIVGGLGEPVAMINGSIVRLGDVIEGATLVQVGPRSATLRWEDQEIVLELPR